MKDNMIREIYSLCKEYQEERPGGLLYLSETGYRKVSKLLGFNHTKLTPKQRKQFKKDCIDVSMGDLNRLKDYNYYLSI
jgi:hypothetical protein